MKIIEPTSIGTLPQQVQILLLDYMKLLDQKYHSIVFGVLLPIFCFLTSASAYALDDQTPVYAICSLFISFSGLMIYSGKPWKLFPLFFSLKNYRAIFKEEFQLDVRRLTSSDIWTGLTLAVDPGIVDPAWGSKNTIYLVMSLLISVITFAIVLCAGIFLRSPTFWFMG